MVKQLHPVNFDITNMQLFYGRNFKPQHLIFLLSFVVGLRHMSK